MKTCQIIESAEDKNFEVMVKELSDVLYLKNIRHPTMSVKIVGENQITLADYGDVDLYEFHNHKFGVMEKIEVEDSQVTRYPDGNFHVEFGKFVFVTDKNSHVEKVILDGVFKKMKDFLKIASQVTL